MEEAAAAAAAAAALVQHHPLLTPSPSPAQQEEMDERTALCKLRNRQGSSNFSSAAFNVINSIIGSGMIGLPYSLKQAGFPLGILLLLGVACITDYSIILLIKGGHLSGTNSYQALVNKAYGFVGHLILSALQFLYPFIAMISYNIITGDTLTKVFQRIPGVDRDNLFIGRHVLILCVTIIFTLPLSLYRNISKLGKVSFISIILTIVILVIGIIRTITFSSQISQSENPWVFAKPNAIQAIGVMSFGMCPGFTEHFGGIGSLQTSLRFLLHQYKSYASGFAGHFVLFFIYVTFLYAVPVLKVSGQLTKPKNQ